MDAFGLALKSNFFSLFNTVDSKQMVNIKVFRWLDSNRGPLVLEATALPSEPQPLPTLKFVCDVGGPGLPPMTHNRVDIEEWSVEAMVRRDFCVTCFFKWANPGLFFNSFSSFQTHITNFTTNMYVKRFSIQYTVPGFELTTFGAWVSAHNH